MKEWQKQQPSMHKASAYSRSINMHGLPCGRLGHVYRFKLAGMVSSTVVGSYLSVWLPVADHASGESYRGIVPTGQ